MNSGRIIRNHNLRREIAEWVLNSSLDELLDLLVALDGAKGIPEFFSCEQCKRLFNLCVDSEDLTTEPCKVCITKYDELREEA